MIASVPLTLVSLEQLQAVADLINDTPEAEVNPAQPSDLAAEVLSHLEVISSGPYKKGTKHIVVCPWASESEHDAGVFVFPDSPIGFDCLHETCPGRNKKGKDLLAFLGLTERAFILDSNGNPKPNLANCITWLETDPIWSGVLGFDEFRLLTVTRKPAPWPQSKAGAVWGDLDDSRTLAYLQHQGISVSSPTVVADAVRIVAQKHGFHPLRDFLDSLTWDGIPRIDTWAHDYFGVADSPYVRAAGRKWLISGCARPHEPACQCDYTATFIGPQGLRKSTLLRALAIREEEWFTDCVDKPGSKDSKLDLRGKWIVEFSELASVARSEEDTVRAFLTCRVDHYRPPYGRASVDVPRQNIFCATTNDPEYNRDSYGDRRKWPMVCTRTNLEGLLEVREQLWAEAMVAYRNHEPWYLPEDLEKEANRQQASHFKSGPYDQALDDWLRRIKPRNYEVNGQSVVVEPFDSSPERVTVRDCLLHGVGFESQAKYGQREQNFVTTYLQHHRWRGPTQTKVNGRNVKFYFRPQEEIDNFLNHKMGEED
jgi:putative DNA primase/helicase